MSRLVLLLALLASPLSAQTSDAWGGPVPCQVVVQRCQTPACWALVSFDNRLIGGLSNVHAVTLTLDGLDVLVTVTQAAGDTPDTMSVVAPYGWRAEPAEVTVEEGESGVVWLVPELVG